jgi:hypothetical protein
MSIQRFAFHIGIRHIHGALQKWLMHSLQPPAFESPRTSREVVYEVLSLGRDHTQAKSLYKRPLCLSQHAALECPHASLYSPLAGHGHRPCTDGDTPHRDPPYQTSWDTLFIPTRRTQEVYLLDVGGIGVVAHYTVDVQGVMCSSGCSLDHTRHTTSRPCLSRLAYPSHQGRQHHTERASNTIS